VRSAGTECVFLLQNVFSYYRMCSLKEMVRAAGITASMNTLIYYSYYYSYLLLVLLLLLLLLELVRSADLAGDGKLSWTEFCLMMSDRLPVARVAWQVVPLFHHLTADEVMYVCVCVCECVCVCVCARART
jgi:hypothetical protein